MVALVDRRESAARKPLTLSGRRRQLKEQGMFLHDQKAYLPV